MKKLLKYILILMVLLLTIISGTTYAKADDTIEEYNGVQYRINSAERWAAVCGYTGTETDVEISSIIGRGIIVSEIDDHAFDGCNSIQILTIPDTIMKVGDMSFIGMNNLKAVISKTQEINIIVKDNVKIVSDRSQLTDEDINKDDNNSSDNKSDNITSNDSKPSTSGESSNDNSYDNGKVSEGMGVIDSNTVNNKSDSSNATLTEGNTDNKVSEGGATISSSDNKKDNNKSTQADDNKNETGSKTTKKFSAPKIIAYIVCVIVIIGLAAGAIIFIKKKRR
ncbi:MAG TPA: hypothetical protein DCL84_07470 [Eubacterium sp.]|nr:hypothetical protein [Eubacterium sp.]